jgi:hypothetical protein
MASLHVPAVGPEPRTPWSRLTCAIRARWLHGRLDAALAAGRSPWSDAALRARAATLSTPEERRRIALSLDGLVRLSELDADATAFLRVRHAAVRSEREALLALASRLRADEPVPVAVVAELARLVGDDTSPLFEGGHPVEFLTAALRRSEARLATPVEQGRAP